VGRIWKHLEKQARKSLEFCKQKSMNSADGSSKNQSVDRNVQANACSHEVSGGKRTVGNLTRPFLLHSGKEFVYILSVF
jgi:hypothetical protein